METIFELQEQCKEGMVSFEQCIGFALVYF